MLSISVGPLSLPLDRLLLLLSFAIAIFVGNIVGRKNNQSADGKIATLFIVSMLVARLVFVIQYWPEYRGDWVAMIDIRDAGFNVWAGAVTALVLTIVACFRYKKLRKSLLAGLGAGAFFWILTTTTLWLIKDTSQKLPTVVVNQLNGEAVPLNDIESGKPRVINLWATWCPPCRREMPVLQQAQQNNPNVGFVFVNQGEHEAVIEQYLSKESLLLENVVADSKAVLGQLAGSRALPTTLFIAADGRIVDAHLGELSSAKLKSKLNRLMKGREGTNEEKR